MLNLGLSDKVLVQLDPKEGQPKVLATKRIIQGETIEIVSSHDLTVIQGKIIFSMAESFANSIKVNPIKLKQMDAEMDLFLNHLRQELVESNSLITQQDIENLQEDERFIQKLTEYKIIDFLTGNIPNYQVADFPNAEVEWNEKHSIWQVVATQEILPETQVCLPKSQD